MSEAATKPTPTTEDLRARSQVFAAAASDLVGKKRAARAAALAKEQAERELLDVWSALGGPAGRVTVQVGGEDVILVFSNAPRGRFVQILNSTEL